MCRKKFLHVLEEKYVGTILPAHVGGSLGIITGDFKVVCIKQVFFLHSFHINEFPLKLYNTLHVQEMTSQMK